MDLNNKSFIGLLGDTPEQQVEKLKEIVRKAIARMPRDHRVHSKCVDYDPAGSTYEEDLIPWIREALVAIGEDPEKYY